MVIFVVVEVAEIVGQVTLGVEIHDEGAVLRCRGQAGQVGGKRGLHYPALAVRDAHHPTQRAVVDGHDSTLTASQSEDAAGAPYRPAL